MDLRIDPELILELKPTFTITYLFDGKFPAFDLQFFYLEAADKTKSFHAFSPEIQTQQRRESRVTFKSESKFTCAKIEQSLETFYS